MRMVRVCCARSATERNVNSVMLVREENNNNKQIKADPVGRDGKRPFVEQRDRLTLVPPSGTCVCTFDLSRRSHGREK